MTDLEILDYIDSKLLEKQLPPPPSLTMEELFERLEIRVEREYSHDGLTVRIFDTVSGMTKQMAP